MKRLFFIMTAALVALAFAVSMSCTKKKETSKNELPPGHEKMVQEMKKGMEASNKIIVAKINGMNLTMTDLVDKMNQVAPMYVRPGEKPSPEMSDKVRQRAMDNMIFEELAVQAAKKQGMQVKPETVDEILKQLKKQLGSESAYNTYLETRGLTEQALKEDIERGQLFRMILAKEIFDKVKKAPEDDKKIKQIYDREKNTFVIPETVVAQDVFIPSGKDSKNAAQLADKILAEIKKNHGDLQKLAPGSGFVVRQKVVTKRLYPKLFDALSAIKPGGISGVISENDGLHIVKVEKKEPSRQMTFEESKHIIKQQLRRQAIEKRKEEWENQLKKNAKIEITLTKADEDKLKSIY